jgi:hypothetical protein
MHLLETIYQIMVLGNFGHIKNNYFWFDDKTQEVLEANL